MPTTRSLRHIGVPVLLATLLMCSCTEEELRERDHRSDPEFHYVWERAEGTRFDVSSVSPKIATGQTIKLAKYDGERVIRPSQVIGDYDLFTTEITEEGYISLTALAPGQGALVITTDDSDLTIDITVDDANMVIVRAVPHFGVEVLRLLIPIYSSEVAHLPSSMVTMEVNHASLQERRLLGEVFSWREAEPERAYKMNEFMLKAPDLEQAWTMTELDHDVVQQEPVRIVPIERFDTIQTYEMYKQQEFGDPEDVTWLNVGEVTGQIVLVSNADMVLNDYMPELLEVTTQSPTVCQASAARTTATPEALINSLLTTMPNTPTTYVRIEATGVGDCVVTASVTGSQAAPLDIKLIVVEPEPAQDMGGDMPTEEMSADMEEQD